MKQLRIVFEKTNLPRLVAHHLVGEDCTITHRLIVGGLIIFVGMVITIIPAEHTVLHLTRDAVGYSLHGLGLHPFIEKFTKTESNLLTNPKTR
jgi:hypothetical protein